MQCPHCLVHFEAEPSTLNLGRDNEYEWQLVKKECPSCKKFIFKLAASWKVPIINQVKQKEILVWPRGCSRPPCPIEVPKEIAEDYKEACLVLLDSPKASAALSRRCLQNIIRTKAGIIRNTLYDEIIALQESATLKSDISDLLDIVRKIGNVAAHPIKSEITGQVLPVEPWEAKWLLEIIEALFDFYYVAPEKNRERLDKLQQKLDETKNSKK